MSASTIRNMMMVSGAIVAVILFATLPFSPVVNGIVAVTFWVAEGFVANWVFNRRAPHEEKLRDLRDRVDNPPS